LSASCIGSWFNNILQDINSLLKEFNTIAEVIDLSPQEIPVSDILQFLKNINNLLSMNYDSKLHNPENENPLYTLKNNLPNSNIMNPLITRPLIYQIQTAIDSVPESTILENFKSNIVEHIDTSDSTTTDASGTPNDPSLPKTDKPFYGTINNPSSETSGSTSETSGSTSETSSGTSKSILDYVFQYSYLISFIGAIAFSISEVLGYNPIEIFHSNALMGYYIFTMFCAIMSLFAWFNTSIWYVDTSIVNPLNVSTSNPWW
jgi:hypothetical protein